MKSWSLIAVAVAILATTGCRVDPNTLLLERELRLQEDEIYRLKSCLEECRRTMQSYGGGDVVMGEMSETYLSPRASETIETPGRPARQSAEGAADSPATRRTQPAGPGATSLPPLEIEFGERLPEGAVPDSFAPPSKTEPPEIINPEPLPRPEAEDQETEEAPRFRPISTSSSGSGGPATQLVLNRLLCGGRDEDGRPGDEGLTVVLQPRDARGSTVEKPGPVAIVVLDPAQEGDAARVARWDFTAAQIARRFRETGRGRAIQLETSWPAAPPVHNDLHLFVRYTGGDGQHLEADQPIRVALPGERPPRWVPTDPPLDAALPAEPPAELSAPRVRIPSTPRIRSASRATRTTTQRPAWSPNRR